MQFVVEKVVQSRGGLSRRVVLKRLEEFLDDSPTGQRMDRVERAGLACGGEDPDLPVPRGRGPVQTFLVDRTGQVDGARADACFAPRIGPHRHRVGRQVAGQRLARRDALLAGDHDLAALNFRIAVDGAADQALAVGPVDRITAQADPHVPLAALVGHELPDVPPGVGEDLRLGGIRRPPGRIFVRIVHLHPRDALGVQLLDLPQQPLVIQRIAGPPPERHLAVARRRIPEPRQSVQARIARGKSGRTFRRRRQGAGRIAVVKIDRVGSGNQSGDRPHQSHQCRKCCSHGLAHQK
jgi:hypothetical protein